ncbi:MAG: LPS export ABC transporter periplasmic protein LptC [Candidatus Saganbacteria bacterium]|nr:LPS export ABC transporter periplasmic protein LptC [Candidatus Saganbacteria bacterium]
MNNKFSLFILFILLLGLISVWTVLIPKETVSEKISKTLVEQKKKADMFMKGVTFAEIVDGVKYWEIKSITSQINKTTGVAVLSDIKGSFFKNGIPSVKFVSPTVKWDMNRKEIRIESPLGYDNKFKFETPYLDWSLSSKKLFTDQDVVFEGDGMTVKGKGLSADAGLETMVLKGGPKADISQDGETMEIEARTFEVNGQTGSILASGEAKAERGDLSIRAESLFYDKEKNKASAAGSVRISYKDIRASSDHAVYDVKNNAIFLSGSAKATREDNELTGDKLIIDIKNNKIMIRGRTKVIVDESLLTKEAK